MRASLGPNHWLKATDQLLRLDRTHSKSFHPFFLILGLFKRGGMPSNFRDNWRKRRPFYHQWGPILICIDNWKQLNNFIGSIWSIATHFIHFWYLGLFEGGFKPPDCDDNWRKMAILPLPTFHWNCKLFDLFNDRGDYNDPKSGILTLWVSNPGDIKIIKTQNNPKRPEFEPGNPAVNGGM